MPFGPLGFSLAPQVLKSKTFSRWIKPFATWYSNFSGYRKYGYVYDDLLVEERSEVQRALSRLTPRENYDRSFRFKRGSQQDVLHKLLPKEQWTSEEQDVRYLKPHVEDVSKEEMERKKWDTMEVTRD